MANYDYLLDSSGKLIVTRNAQDIYVSLRVGDCAYYVPVLMPRRCPGLRFDLHNPGEDLWTYLDTCARELSPENVADWRQEHLDYLAGAETANDKLLRALVQSGTVCSSCFFTENDYNPNPQKNIQQLRDKGYIILTQRAVDCPRCGKRKTKYTITPVLMTQTSSTEFIPFALKKRICKAFDYRDAYTGIYNPVVEAHIPDHKFPEDRRFLWLLSVL